MVGGKTETNGPNMDQIPSQKSRCSRIGLHPSSIIDRRAVVLGHRAIRSRECTAQVGAHRRVVLVDDGLRDDCTGASR